MKDSAKKLYMIKLLKKYGCPYASIDNFFALKDENAYDEIRSILEEKNIGYSCDEDSYSGIYAILLI